MGVRELKGRLEPAATAAYVPARRRLAAGGARLQADLWRRITAVAILAVATISPSLAATPQRIVSTAPSITEMLFALGAGDRVVGVTTYCRFPAEARQKPKIGGYASPDVEAILRQRPDLVVILADRPDLSSKLSAFRLPTLSVRQERLADIERSIGMLAAQLGLETRGRELAAGIRRDLARVSGSVSGLPRRTVLFVVGRNPGSLTDIYTPGGGSYIDELITFAGGSNVFRDVTVPYAKVSLEEILARDPDVIVDISDQGALNTANREPIQRLWERFPSLRAVRNHNVHILTDDIFVVPGPRVTNAVAALARVIHGDRPRK